MEIDYERLSASVEAGTLRIELERELETGFREMVARGDAIPPPSYLATKIAEVVYRAADGGEGISEDLAYNLYQEILSACENAKETVMGESHTA
jgi:hypothetical protein